MAGKSMQILLRHSYRMLPRARLAHLRKRKMMNHALIYRTFGAPMETLKLEASELPRRDPSKVRVRMSSAPVNPSDLIPITGAYRHRINPPLVAGYEGVGVVCEVEPGSAWRVGQRVLALRGPGTWQRYVDLDSASLISVPDDIPDLDAARAYINPISALVMLRCWSPQGKRVLLTGAGGSCARLLSQWSLQQGASSVTGIYRTPPPSHAVALGVSVVMDWDSEACEEAVRSADLVFDAVGGELADRVLQGMRPSTQYVVYGQLSGYPPSSYAGRRIGRFHLREHISHLSPHEFRALFDEVWPRLRASRLPPCVAFPLSEWKSALNFFALKGRTHKPILTF
jgi:NADPH:quinone reductase-like Zn-dependent oxidoreductase